MTEAEGYRQQSDQLLRRAAKAENLNERSTLIDQAIHFNQLALETDRVAAEGRRIEANGVAFHPPSGKQAYRQTSETFVRRAAEAKDPNERGRLISQAVHFYQLSHEAERPAAEMDRGKAPVVPFNPQAENYA